MAQAETEQYMVRLSMVVDGTDPGDAAMAFVDRLVDRGMRDWVYTVHENTEQQEPLGYFDGYGLPLDISQLANIAAVSDEADEPTESEVTTTEDTPAVQDVELPAEQSPSDDDDALLAVARQANADRT